MARRTQVGRRIALVDEIPEARNSQHVLKAVAAMPDATDRELSVNASPVGGPMGAWQPAAAGPSGGQGVAA